MPVRTKTHFFLFTYPAHNSFPPHPPALAPLKPSEVQTANASRLGKMQTQSTPSGFGPHECSDGRVRAVPWSSGHSGCQKTRCEGPT